MVGESIVEYFGEHESYYCGYCKSSGSSCSNGMWGHRLTAQVYQDLIDRGWRRSGKHCYKPTMNRTCCPQYTIRCEALKFKLSKSQKKVLKRMHRFLATGYVPNGKSMDDQSPVSEQETQPMDSAMDVPMPKKSCFDENVDISFEASGEGVQSQCTNESSASASKASPQTTLPSEEGTSLPKEAKLRLKKSPQGIDPDKPPCRKAKDIRRERRMQKLLKAGMSPTEAAMPSKKCTEKTLEDFLTEPFLVPPVHRLELRLVPCDFGDARFSDTIDKSFHVYQKYQTSIHHDSVEKCCYNQYVRFLVNSPFQFPEQNSGTELVYRSYHQQYWLDDEIIAVGVIDILPHCISSVYLYYDPEYSFLSLGTYAALREIALTRELHLTHPELAYYYMGFYIHSCPKMRYKMAFSPSFLLCPETYTFQPIEKCIPKLEISKYHRLEDDRTKGDPNGIVHLNEVMILYHRQTMTYEVYRRLNKAVKDEQEARQYASCVGRKCYSIILLYRT